jgi:hypothetical protein
MGTSAGGWRRSRRRQKTRDLRYFWRDKRARLVIGGVILLIVSIYVFRWARVFYYSSIAYSDIGLGDRKADIVYGLGLPQATMATDGVWLRNPDQTAMVWSYQTAAGGRTVVQFDPADQRARTISCFEPMAEPAACPPLFGMGLGTNEEHIRHVLGNPDAETLVGGVKTLSYQDIGASFGLTRYVVYKITLTSNRYGGMRRVTRLAAALLPTFGR